MPSIKSYDSIELPPSRGVAVRLQSGAGLRLINTFGSQVVDTWAICADEHDEHMSMEHTRRLNGHLHPVVGDTLWSNRRHAMLSLDEDTFSGTHDTIVACCDRWLYEYFGCPPGHANCHDNYLGALKRLGIERDRVPNPLNLWMNVPVDGNTVTVTGPLSRPGDSVAFTASRDVILVFSTCPMDVAPAEGAAAINGADCTPRPVHYEYI